MDNNTKKLLSLLLAAVMMLSLLSSCNGGNDAETPDDEGNKKPSVSYGSDIGEAATPYGLERIGSDEKVSIKDYRGKVVVVNFWGTWCVPCKNELPDFDKVAEERNDVVIIAVHSHNGREDALGYVSDLFSDSKIVFAYDIPRMNNTDMYYDLLGGSRYYPYTVVLNADGVITFAKDGAMSYEQLNNAIDAAK